MLPYEWQDTYIFKQTAFLEINQLLQLTVYIIVVPKSNMYILYNIHYIDLFNQLLLHVLLTAVYINVVFRLGREGVEIPKTVSNNMIPFLL